MIFSVGENISIPSPIDVHVHLREPGGTEKETINSGTLAALAGGYQAVFDMPNNPKHNETWWEERLDEKIAIALENAHTDIGFYAGANLENPAIGELAGMVTKAAGLKLYMDRTTGNSQTYGLETAREVIDEWIFQARKKIPTAPNQKPPILLHAREGVGAETAKYIARQGYPVHWCHIATKTEVALAAKLTKQFPEFYTGGVTPHHLTMTKRNAEYQQGWNGARMQPPLGGEVDAGALLAAYNKGDLQILETDHAPHTHADKMAAEADNPNGLTEAGCVTCFGVSGIEFVLPVMMSLVQRNLITMERLVDSLHYQPLKMLGLSNAANLAFNTTQLRVTPYVLDSEAQRIKSNVVIGKSTNTPYFGWTAWAEVISVVKNGRELRDFKIDTYEDHGPVNILRAGKVIGINGRKRD